MASGEFEIINMLEELLKTYAAAGLGGLHKGQARAKPLKEALAQLRAAFEETLRASGAAPTLTPELLYDLLRLHLRTTDSALALWLGAQGKAASQPPAGMSVPPSLELQGALGARAKGELEVKNEGARAREVHLRLGHLRASEGEPFEVKAGFLDGEGFPLRGALSVEAGEAAVASLWVELDPQAFEAGQCYQGELVAEDQDGVQETISVGLTVLPHGEPDVLSDGVPSDGAPSDGAPSDGGPHEGGERLERLEAQLAELRAQLEAQNKQQALLLEQLSRFVGGASGEQPAGEQPAGEKPAGEKPAGVGGRQRRPKSGGG